MAKYIRLVIDAMGGDQGPPVTVPAALAVLSEKSDLAITLVGDRSRIQENIPSSFDHLNRVDILHAEQVIAMHDKPATALRKTDSSLVQGLNLLAKKQGNGFISAGNTGALVMLSMRVLGTLPDIERPAICTFLPSKKGNAYLLDMGANVQCSAVQLHQFGIMASCAVKLRENIERPTVGLLNIGTEELKGTPEVQKAADLFENDSRLNYIGFVEGNSLFEGDVDIVVCDGFNGNVALKSIEGLANMISRQVKQAFNQGVWARLVGLLAFPVVKKLIRHINPEFYNGASLLGVNGVVIKSHGAASIAAYKNAIEVGYLESRNNLPERLAQELRLHQSLAP